MNQVKLAIALRSKASEARDIVVIPDCDQTLRDAVTLIRVLANIVEGMPLSKAFGPPGDWGYESKIGQAIASAPNAL